MANEVPAVGKTEPSRPSKFMIVILVGVVVGFFAIIFSSSEEIMKVEKQSQPTTVAQPK